MTTLLVLTAGQSDVQLVIGGVRHELEPKMCGVLHDEIAHRGYRVVDVPTHKDQQRKGSLPEGNLTVCTPKLDAALRYFEGNSAPVAALIFDTRRTYPSDPRLAGDVLERRLNERGVQAVHCHTLLKGQDLLEADDPPDAVVRREVVQGIAQVLAMEFAEVKPDNVVVATTGGLDAASAVIEELIRLYSVEFASVQVLEIPDRALTGKDDRAVPEKFHPATGFRARWQALSLIEGGNLLSAWGAVSHLRHEPGQEWTRIIDWLRCFASSLPLPSDCNVSVLKHPHMAVRAALRVELALRAGDIPRGVLGTVAFLEAGLWDYLGERFERSADPKKRRYYKVISGDAPTGNKLLRIGDNSADDRKRPFEKKETLDGVDWYWIDDGDGGPAVRLAKNFLGKAALTKLATALSKDIRDLRNDVAHAEPTDLLMNDARRRMQAAELWSTTDTFLSQPIVCGVLNELGESEPSELLTRLLADIRKLLHLVDRGNALALRVTEDRRGI